MLSVSKVGIIAKPRIRQGETIVPKLLHWLKARHISFVCDENAAQYGGVEGVTPRESLVVGCDLIVVLGGDGTLLAAARALSGQDTPVLPVNLGGLGFLTAITVDELYGELERFLRGEARIGTRRLLQCEILREGTPAGSYNALNDVVLSKASIARMIDLETYIDRHLVCHYKADGLIISTPTGSTAYSLSAGGPIIFPSVAGLCITPICPHMLTNRPVIVPDASQISVRCLSPGEDTFLTIDGQVGQPLLGGDEVICRSSAHYLRLVRPPNQRFFDVLREKLKWGER